MKKRITAMLKAAIVTSIAIFCLSGRGNSQEKGIEYDVINAMSDYISTYNTDSVIRVSKNLLSVEWDQLLEMQVLKRNIYAKKDTEKKISPFDPIPIEEFLLEEDLEYMNRNSSLPFKKWDKKGGLDKKKFRVINRRKSISLTKKKFDIKDFIEISAPIFREDFKIAIIVINRYCGMECGEGILYIFENKDGKWKHLCQVPLWVS